MSSCDPSGRFGLLFDPASHHAEGLVEPILDVQKKTIIGKN
jgi:hypothetical protein